uniref:Serpentine receptor class gamma n=1 Tax=Meloidogyne floridensis TaxID=298350 RepID=A0A915NQL0_9BILA
MELYIFRHSDYLRFYNCTPEIINEMEKFSKHGDSSTPSYHIESFIIILLGILSYLFYLPCICVIWRYSFTQSCYKLLLYIGFTDLLNICVCGFLHAFLALQRASFCIYPNLIYFAGMIGVFLWLAETTADLILAFNRCLFVVSPSLARLVFDGKRTYIWLLISSSYAFYGLSFTPPMIFSPKYFAWFGNPYTGFRNDLADKTFIQVFIISFLNTSVAGLYVLMDYLTIIPQWIFTTAGIGWLAIHGFPPLIYLTLNKTIREDTRHAFKIIYKRLKIIIGVNNNDNIVHPALVNNYIGHHVDI